MKKIVVVKTKENKEVTRYPIILGAMAINENYINQAKQCLIEDKYVQSLSDMNNFIFIVE